MVVRLVTTLLVLLCTVSAQAGWMWETHSSQSDRSTDKAFYSLTDREDPLNPAPWEWYAPIWLFADFEKRVLNLTPQDPTLHEMTLDDYRSGLLVIKKTQINIGFAPGWLSGLSSIVARAGHAIGVLPLFGGKSVATHFVKGPEEIDRLPPVRLPTSPEDMRSWQRGDRISYEAFGGAIVSLSPSYPGLKPGMSAVFAGSWVIEIEKAGDEWIFARYKKKKLTSVTFGMSMPVIGAGHSDLWDRQVQHAFSFNLGDPRGLRAYLRFIQGDLRAAEALGKEKETDSPVKAVQTRNTATLMDSTTWGFGIPILAMTSWASGTITSSRETDFHQNGLQSMVHYSAHFKDHSAGGVFIGRRQERSDFFSARYVSQKPRDGGAMEVLSDGEWGQFIWNFEDSRSTRAILERKLLELKRRTGLYPSSIPGIPEGRLGYARVSLRTLFPSLLTHKLMQFGTENPKIFLTTALGIMDKYFANGTDPDDLCIPQSPGAPIGDETPALAVKNLAECRESHRRQIINGTKALVKALRKMKAVRDKDHAEFSAAYSKFGKHFSSNRFVFESVLSLVAPFSPKIEFCLDGERLSQLQKNIEWHPDPAIVSLHGL